MEKQAVKYSKVPHYHGLRIYLISTILYFFLVFPIAGILLFKYVPDYLKNAREKNPDLQLSSAPGQRGNPLDISIEAPVDSNKIKFYQDSSINISLSLPGSGDDKTTAFNVDSPGERSQMGDTMGLLVRLLLVSFVLGFAFNLPFRIYFRHKRKYKPIKPKIVQFCRKFLLRSPLINAGILFLSYGITILYMLYMITMKKDVEDLSRQFYLQFFYITLVSSLLTILLVYFWMKHQVHIRYL